MITRAQLTSPLGISIAAIVVTAIVLVTQVPRLFSALFIPSASEEVRVAGIEKSLAKHADARKVAEERFAGRSMFFPPQPDKITPAPAFTKAPDAPPPPPPGPKPPPAKYAGPLVPKLLLGEEAWFSRGREEVVRMLPGDEDSGVKLLAVEAPWSVHVAWSGGDYHVPVFADLPEDRDLLAQHPFTPGRGLIDMMGSGMGGAASHEPSHPATPTGRERSPRTSRPTPSRSPESVNR